MPQEQLPLGKKDPDNYRELSKPFGSLTEAQDAIEGFWDAFYELRNKYRVPDVVCVVSFNCLSEDGAEGQSIMTLQAGNILMVEPLLAYAFGRAQKDASERLAKALKQGRLTNKRGD